MTAQRYIQTKLDELKQPSDAKKPITDQQLIDAIYAALMSKKFRKYSANEELQQHVRNAIRINVEKREPINITFLHGPYKLWRLNEAPETDWAELFALMYYSRWVKPVCEIYEPGVWFDFYLDDWIITRLNTASPADVAAYIASYQSAMDFLKQYQPGNLNMTITLVGSKFPSEEAFDESLQRNLEKLQAGGLPVLSEPERAMVELNTNPTKAQLQDPSWREKVLLLHNAYLATKAEAGYHKGRPEKIMAFVQPLPSGTTISVGTTKKSIMKFWIGVGVLEQQDDSYDQNILSPKQLKDKKFTWQNVNLQGLKTKNFTRIRVMQ